MFSVSFIIGDVIGVTIVACHSDCHSCSPACSILESSNKESAKKHNPVCKPIYLSGLDNARFFFISRTIWQQNKTGEQPQKLDVCPPCALQPLCPERQGYTARPLRGSARIVCPRPFLDLKILTGDPLFSLVNTICTCVRVHM